MVVYYYVHYEMKNIYYSFLFPAILYFRSDDGPLPSECALKVFKTTLSEFKTREKYIKDDHRFRDRYSKQNPRKIIKLWAEKEFRNLNRCVVNKIFLFFIIEFQIFEMFEPNNICLTITISLIIENVSNFRFSI